VAVIRQIGSWLTAAAIASGLAPAAHALAAPGGGRPTVLLVDDDVRLRRSDAARARAEAERLLPAGGELVLRALRGETVAFQVVVVAAERPIAAVALTVSGLDGGGPRAEVFREHYLAVRQRSRNDRHPDESLGWSPGARPPDAEMLGEIPDALLPIDLDPRAVAPAPAVAAGELAALWIDVHVPEETAAGSYRGAIEVAADGVALARAPIRVEVSQPVLPYRATSVFVFYEPERLERRLGGGDAEAAERQLWQLLHRHHVDALAPLRDAADVARLLPAYRGTLFGPAAGYDGPGQGAPPAVVALGAYGVLGPPRPEALARVDRMAALLPQAIGDVFLYAVDEDCRSPLAGDWKRALAGRPAAARVRVGQTCGAPPDKQDGDVALVPAPAFTRASEPAARA
jgi:hypothetical protein